MKTFKYKIVQYPCPSGFTNAETEFNALGKDGWELVSVCPLDIDGGSLLAINAVFKKEVIK